MFFGVLGAVSLLTPIDLPLGIWLGLMVVPLFAAQYFAFRDVRRQRDSAQSALVPRLLVECGNILGEFFLRWHGPGAAEHPPVVLLRIRNTSPLQQAKACRAQAWLEPWDEQRFDPLPRDLPWWRGYERYSQHDRPLETTLAPEGSGWVVLADESDQALQLRPFDVDEDTHEYLMARVVAWSEGPGRTERTFQTDVE